MLLYFLWSHNYTYLMKYISAFYTTSNDNFSFPHKSEKILAKIKDIFK